MRELMEPVVVHRPLNPPSLVPQPRPIVVGVACAPGDDAVLAFAFEEAALRGVPLLAVHIWPGHPSGREEADQALAAALNAWSEKYPLVTVDRLVRNGIDVTVGPTAASRSAQLAVVGARCPDESLLCVGQLLAGTDIPIGTPVAGRLDQALHRAGCSVAVVPVHL